MGQKAHICGVVSCFVNILGPAPFTPLFGRGDREGELAGTFSPLLYFGLFFAHAHDGLRDGQT